MWRNADTGCRPFHIHPPPKPQSKHTQKEGKYTKAQTLPQINLTHTATHKHTSATLRMCYIPLASKTKREKKKEDKQGGGIRWQGKCWRRDRRTSTPHFLLFPFFLLSIILLHIPDQQHEASSFF